MSYIHSKKHQSMKNVTEKSEAKASSPIPILRRVTLYLARDRKSSWGAVLLCVPRTWIESGATMEPGYFRKFVPLFFLGCIGFILMGFDILSSLGWTLSNTENFYMGIASISIGVITVSSLPFLTLGQMHKQFIANPRKKYDPEDLRRGMIWLPVGIAVIAVIKEFDLVKDYVLSLFGQ